MKLTPQGCAVLGGGGRSAERQYICVSRFMQLVLVFLNETAVGVVDIGGRTCLVVCVLLLQATSNVIDAKDNNLFMSVAL